MNSCEISNSGGFEMNVMGLIGKEHETAKTSTKLLSGLKTPKLY